MFLVVAFTANGSAEELIKKELQAVAEGVAASVFQSSTPSTPDIPAATDASGFEGNQEIDCSTRNIEMQHKAKFEVCISSFSICMPIVPHRPPPPPPFPYFLL